MSENSVFLSHTGNWASVRENPVHQSEGVFQSTRHLQMWLFSHKEYQVGSKAAQGLHTAPRGGKELASKCPPQ